MFSGNNISKGGIAGAIIGLLASFFSHRRHDSTSKKALKTGAFGLAGFLLGAFAEKKWKERKRP